MSAEMDENTVLTAAPDMVWRDVGGEMVLLDPNQNKIMGLNATGGLVWQGLDGERTLGDIAGEIAVYYEAAVSAVIEDVLCFARLLVERGLASSKS